MKRSLRLLTVLLSAVLILTLALPGFAALPGTITIDNPIAQVTYRAYRILELESFADPNPEDPSDGAYAYRVNPVWAEFVNARTEYLTVDDSGYVTWVEDADPAAFAALAGAWAREKGIVPDAGPAASEDGQPVVFDNLPLGYYMVDSSVGALCSLDTTNPNVTIYEKNEEPTITKTVQDPVTFRETSEISADIGELVRFTVQIQVKPGAVNYVLEDTLSKGMTFEPNANGNPRIYFTSLRENGENVFVDSIQFNEPEVLPDGYRFTPRQEDYTGDLLLTVKENADGTTTVKVMFPDDFVQNRVKGGMQYGEYRPAEIFFYYGVRLNKDAVIGGEGNDNRVHLQYGHEPKVTPDEKAVVNTFEFDIHKTDGKKPLPGVGFVLYKVIQPPPPKSPVPEGKESEWVPIGPPMPPPFESTFHPDPDHPTPYSYAYYHRNSDGTVGWYDIMNYDKIFTEAAFRQCVADGTITEVMTDSSGNVRFTGLAAGTYYLLETTTPDGYNKLKYPIQVTIGKDGSITYNFPGEAGTTAPDRVVPVVNKTGSELPETGGMGTTVFYVTGGAMVLAAAFLLLKKKKYSA